MGSNKYFITHIVPATTSIVSLVLLMTTVYYCLYEQWIYVTICIIAIVLDFYIYIVLTKIINKKHSTPQIEANKTTTLKDLH